jgi:Bacteriophage lambda head decoration protein D
MAPLHLNVTAPRIESDVVKFRLSDEYCTEDVTVAAQSPYDTELKIGTVLGKVTSGGKYVPINFSASDGSQHAAAVCLQNAVVISSDLAVRALVRGPAIVLGVADGLGAVGGLIWPSGATNNQIAGAIAELAAINPAIVTRDS